MKKIDQLVLFIGILLIIFGVQYIERETDPVPSPAVPVVIPDVVPPSPQPVVPDLVNNIIYDNCDEALRLSKLHNRPLILIFGASWCSYCKDLKKDISSIKPFDRAVVCVVDIEKNENLVKKYSIKGLPTSIIIIQDQEKSRKSGYQKHDYETWLNGNL